MKIHEYEYESKDYSNKTLSVEGYLNKIRPYLKDINNLKKSETWKTQLTIINNFISSIDNDEKRVMHSKSDNTKIMINDEADEVLIHLNQNNLEPMKVGSLSSIMFNYLL